MKSVIIAAFLGLTITTHARLGETVDEIQKRYGEPVNVGKARVFFPSHLVEGNLYDMPVTNYFFKDYIVTVFFKDGKSASELVVPKTRRLADADEIESLIKAIGGEGYTKGLTGKIWKKADGGRAVDLDGELQVATAAFEKHFRDFQKREEASKRAAAKKKADGF